MWLAGSIESNMKYIIGKRLKGCLAPFNCDHVWLTSNYCIAFNFFFSFLQIDEWMNTDFHFLIKLSSIQEDLCQFTHISHKIYRTEAGAKACEESVRLALWWNGLTKEEWTQGLAFFFNLCNSNLFLVITFSKFLAA